MNGCVAVKAMLLDILKDAEPDTLVESVETVLNYLELSKGFFMDCEYEYKAVEIAERCRSLLSDQQRDTTNHKRKARCERGRQRAYKLESELHQAKMDRYATERARYDALQAQLVSWEHPSEAAA